MIAGDVKLAFVFSSFPEKECEKKKLFEFVYSLLLVNTCGGALTNTYLVLKITLAGKIIFCLCSL